MKRSYLLILLVSSIIMSTSTAQIIKWEHYGNVWGQGIISDANSNLLVTGFFSETATFGSTQLTSSGNWDIFIAKYNQDGECLWAKRAGGTDPDLAWEINLDGAGNIYLIGEFRGIAHFDNVTVTSNGNSDDIFIAKYDSSGMIVWAKRAGGEYTDYGRDLVFDNTGNLLITGSCRGTSSFGNLQVNGPGFYVAKYTSEGNCLWVKHTLVYGSTESLGISLDAQGNIYQTGLFGAPFTIGNTQLVNEGTSDGLLVKYDFSGNFLWARKFGGSGADFALGIASYNNDGVAITGRFENTAYFGDFVLTTIGNEDVFMVKYDGNGNCLWAKSGGGAGADRGQCVEINSDGDALFAGYFEGSASFGSIVLPGIGGRDSYIAAINSEGQFRWAKQLGGGGNREDGIYALTLRTNGDIFSTGMGCIINKLVKPSLNITSPNIGDTWTANSHQNITWNGDIDGLIDIFLSTDAGSSWILLDSNVLGVNKYKDIIVPRNISSSTCKVKLVSKDYNFSSILTGEFEIIHADLTIKLSATNGNNTDENNFFRTSNSATEGYDPTLDTPNPPTPPGNYIDAYFYHPEWNSPLGSKFASDVKQSTDLADTVKRWFFEVETNVLNDTVKLQFTQENVPLKFGKYLTDMQTGKRVDLRFTDSYKYYSTNASPRKFMLIVGDSTSPLISNLIPKGDEIWRSNSQKTVSWNMTDGTGIDSVFLFVSKDNGSNYTQFANIGKLNSFNWSVPLEYLNNGYRVKALVRDSLGNTAETISPLAFTVVGDSLSTQSLAGWNLFSTPIEPTDNTVLGIFGDDVTANPYFVWGYGLSTGYIQPTSVTFGSGYWLGLLASVMILKLAY